MQLDYSTNQDGGDTTEHKRLPIGLISSMINNSSSPGQNLTARMAPFFSKAEVIGWCVGYGIIDVLVIVTNLLTILVFLRSNLLRNRTYYFLLCLAIADIMVGTISLPLYIHSWVIFITGGEYDPVVSMVPTATDIFSGFASIIALTTIALERLYSVVLPNWHLTTPGFVYCILIALIWTLSGVFLSIRLLEDADVLPDKSMLYCVIAAFFFFLVVLCLAYIGIWCRVRHRMHEKTSRALEKDKKLAMTLFLITAIFLLSWVPFQALNIYTKETDDCCDNDMFILVTLTKMMQYMNSFVNPIIYAFKMPDFRRVLLGLFRAPVGGFSSTKFSSKMLTGRRKRASTLRTSDGEPNGNCENAV